MIPIQSAAASAALVEEFGIKGRFRLAMDELVVPVAVVADVRPTQFEGATYEDVFQIPATVGEVPTVLIAGSTGEPGGRFIVKPLELRVRSVGALANLDCRFDNTTAIVLTGSNDLLGLNRLHPRRPTSPLVATAGTVAAASGTAWDSVRCVADVDTFVDLRGWHLDPGAAVAGQFDRLAFFGSAVNTAMNVRLIWSIQPVDD